MADSQLSGADSGTPAIGKGRRTALTAAATAAVGAVGVVLAKPAEAAAGSALLLGRSNSSGGSATSVSSSTTGTAFGVTATAGHGLVGIAKLSNKFGILARNDGGSGTGGAVLADGKANAGVVGRTTSKDQYGVAALNSGPLGLGGALGADGGANAGVVAFTSAPRGANAQPAIYADGGAGAWASWLLGDEVVDGTLFAAFSLVGVQDPVNISYREAVSGEDPVHTQSGRADLTAGSATVTVTDSFLAAADLGAVTTAVQLTAMDTGMPNLSATITTTGFTINGGAATGSVSWTVTAPRRPPATSAAAAAAAPKASTRLTSPATLRKTSAPKRPSLPPN